MGYDGLQQDGADAQRFHDDVENDAYRFSVLHGVHFPRSSRLQELIGFSQGRHDSVDSPVDAQGFERVVHSSWQASQSVDQRVEMRIFVTTEGFRTWDGERLMRVEVFPDDAIEQISQRVAQLRVEFLDDSLLEDTDLCYVK